MQNNASNNVVAISQVAGDLIPHEEGQSLRIDSVYDQRPVLCPAGCRAGQCIVDLVDDDVVTIINIPFGMIAKYKRYELSDVAHAVRVGGWKEPAFRIILENGNEGPVISYQEFLSCSGGCHVEFHVERIQSEFGPPDEGC